MPEVRRASVGSVRADNAGLGDGLGEEQGRGEQAGKGYFAGSVGFHAHSIFNKTMLTGSIPQSSDDSSPKGVSRRVSSSLFVGSATLRLTLVGSCLSYANAATMAPPPLPTRRHGH